MSSLPSHEGYTNAVTSTTMPDEPTSRGQSRDWEAEFGRLRDIVEADKLEYYGLEVRMRKQFGITVAAFFKEIYVASKSKRPPDGWVLKDREWLREHHGFSDSNVKTARRALKDAGILETKNGAGRRAHWKILPWAVVEMFYPDSQAVSTSQVGLNRPHSQVDSTSQSGQIDLTHKKREGKEKESVAHDLSRSLSFRVKTTGAATAAEDNDDIDAPRDPAQEEPAWLAKALPVFETLLEEKGLSKPTNEERVRLGKQFVRLYRQHKMDHDTARAVLRRMCDRWRDYRLSPSEAFKDVTVNYPDRYPAMSREEFKSWRDDGAAPQGNEWHVGDDGTVTVSRPAMGNEPTAPPSRRLLERWEFPRGAPDWVNDKLRAIYKRQEEEIEARKLEDTVDQLPEPPGNDPSRLVVEKLPIEEEKEFGSRTREAVQSSEPVQRGASPLSNTEATHSSIKATKTGAEIVSEFALVDDHALGCDCDLCLVQTPRYVTYPPGVIDPRRLSFGEVA